ncbi:MAG: hypothetical protein RLZZ210_60 [Pseudomonadota bacterium]|jgi:hypothetical protein
MGFITLFLARKASNFGISQLNNHSHNSSHTNSGAWGMISNLTSGHNMQHVYSSVMGQQYHGGNPYQQTMFQPMHMNYQQPYDNGGGYNYHQYGMMNNPYSKPSLLGSISNFLMRNFSSNSHSYNYNMNRY